MRRLILVAFVVAGALGAVHSAGATYPGANGRIAFSTDQDPNGNVEIYTVNSNGSGETQLTHGEFGHASDPSWAPDGSKIAFSSCNQSGSCTIDVIKSDGSGTAVQLTSDPWEAFDPAWSPDGTRIAFGSNQDGFLSAIWVMNADGTNQHRLTAPALEAFYPDWSPDGKHLVFTDRCCQFGSNIWVMNADGSGPKQITHMPNKHQDGFAHYSPDGKRIVLGADLDYSNGLSNLYTMDTNGTHMTRIVSDQPGVFFSDWGTSS